MSSYWDYLAKAVRSPLSWTVGPGGDALFNMLYDNAHGSNKYWLSKTPIYGWLRKARDSAQQAQDQWDNTGRDPAYSTRLNGPGFEYLYGAVGTGLGFTRMASSLSAVYTPEVVEDVGFKFNGMYR